MRGRSMLMLAALAICLGTFQAARVVAVEPGAYTVNIADLRIDGASPSVEMAFSELVVWNPWSDATLTLTTAWELLGDDGSNGVEAAFAMAIYEYEPAQTSEHPGNVLGLEVELLATTTHVETVTPTTDSDGLLSIMIPLEGARGLLVVEEAQACGSSGCTDKSWLTAIKPGVGIAPGWSSPPYAGFAHVCNDTGGGLGEAPAGQESTVVAMRIHWEECLGPCDTPLEQKICEVMPEEDFPEVVAGTDLNVTCDGHITYHTVVSETEFTGASSGGVGFAGFKAEWDSHFSARQYLEAIGDMTYTFSCTSTLGVSAEGWGGMNRRVRVVFLDENGDEQAAGPACTYEVTPNDCFAGWYHRNGPGYGGGASVKLGSPFVTAIEFCTDWGSRGINEPQLLGAPTVTDDALVTPACGPVGIDYT